MLCVALYTTAYLCLIPGLTSTLFTAKAEMFGFTLLDMEKSTVGTVRLLIDQQMWLPAIIILIFSVLMPFIKLFMVLAYVVMLQRGLRSQAATVEKWLKHISKWATVDAFAAVLVVGCFANQPPLQVQLHTGYYCFLGYCILSVAAALLTRPDLASLAIEEDLAEDEEPYEVEQEPMVSDRSAFVLAFCALVVLGVVTCGHGIIQLEIKLLQLKNDVSIQSLVIQLLSNNSTIAAASIFFLVILCPAADLAASMLALGTPRVNRVLKCWIEEFAMLDVFALALFVVILALKGLNKQLDGQLLPAGRFLLAAASVAVACRWGTRLGVGAKAKAREKHTI